MRARSEREGDTDYLVLELIEGGTLGGQIADSRTVIPQTRMSIA